VIGRELQLPPKYRYTFGVSDDAGPWGSVTVGASDHKSAVQLAERTLTRLESSALRVGFRLRLQGVKRNT
jgi:hypothetical protein